MDIIKRFLQRQSAGLPAEINFRASDWFDQYIAYRKANPIQLDIPQPDDMRVPHDMRSRFQSLQYPLYNMLLHSGLIYGFPFLYPFRPAPDIKWSNRWITKLTLIDIITYSALWQKDPECIETGKVAPEALEEAARLVRLYFRGVNVQSAGLQEDTIEHVLSSRISFRRNWLDWRRRGINCHLFWDWYFFLEFLDALDSGAAPDGNLFVRLAGKKREMKLRTMKFIAAAAHSDQSIQLSERVLQHHFQKSSHFFSPADRKRIAREFRDGLTLEQIHIPQVHWTARRYWLDISLMTIFSDKTINEAENNYLQDLVAKLDLDTQSLTESQMGLGGFLLRYGRRLPFFDSKRASLNLIGKALAENMENLHQATHGELEETVEMAKIIGRLLQGQLGTDKHKRLPTEDEIAFAFDQIRDLPRFLPFFSLMFMPVPGIMEMYILLAFNIERLTGDQIRLLPSNFSRMIRQKMGKRKE